MLSQPYTRREYQIQTTGVYGAPVVSSSLSGHTLLAVPLISRASVVQVHVYTCMLDAILILLYVTGHLICWESI